MSETISDRELDALLHWEPGDDIGGIYPHTITLLKRAIRELQSRRSTGERERALEEAAKVADQMAREEDVLADHYRDHTPSPEQREDAMCRAAAHRDVATNIRALKSQELREEI
jgi:hypothetical protein